MDLSLSDFTIWVRANPGLLVLLTGLGPLFLGVLLQRFGGPPKGLHAGTDDDAAAPVQRSVEISDETSEVLAPEPGAAILSPAPPVRLRDRLRRT